MGWTFPLALLPLLRCTKDGGALSSAKGDAPVSAAQVDCTTCSATFHIRDGILDLLGQHAIADPENLREHDARDIEAAMSRGAPGVALSIVDELEIAGTMRHLGALAGKTVVELGSGAGVYTRLLAQGRARIVAVDFSAEHLRLNAAQSPSAERVALVRADVATLRLAPAAFDVAFTTLYSNLPSRGLRSSMNALVHAALRPGGKYLVSAHHHDLRRRVRAAPKRTRYEKSGIFFENLTADDLAGELRDFSPVRTIPTAICLPFVTRLLRDPVQRRMERMPLLNLFGAILLADARKG